MQLALDPDLNMANVDGTKPLPTALDSGHAIKWIDVYGTAPALNPQGSGRTPTKRTHDVTVQLGILALLEAKPGRGDDLAAFLQAGRELAVAEQGTVTWYAFKISDSTYGIFDTFETGDARDAHLGGQIPQALGQVAPDLLAADPDIRTVDIIAVK